METSKEVWFFEEETQQESRKKHWFFEDADLSEIPFSQRTFKQKLRVIRLYVILGLFAGVLLIVVDKLKERPSRREELRNKLRHYKPTIHEGTWSKSISWEERDTPLTDEELKRYD